MVLRPPSPSWLLLFSFVWDSAKVFFLLLVDSEVVVKIREAFPRFDRCLSKHLKPLHVHVNRTYIERQPATKCAKP